MRYPRWSVACDDGVRGRREMTVSTPLLDFLRAQQAQDWASFRGTSIHGTLPITEDLIRELVERRPPPRGVRVAGIHVLPGEVLRVDIVVGASLLSKRLSPEFHLSGVHGLPGHPSVTADVPRAYGTVLSRVLRGQLDETYVLFDGHRLTVGLRGLIEQMWGAEAAALVPLLKRADLRSEPGTLFVDFDIEAP